jgi:Tfp pilus assembly protein PilF
MLLTRGFIGAGLAALLILGFTWAQEKQPQPDPKSGQERRARQEKKADDKKADENKAGDKKADDKMPWSGLAPAKLVPNLCLLHYPISTQSAQCQAFFDQGLGYLYSYVWMEAARSFETATRHDPECAMAWWGLSRALEPWLKGDHIKALKKADELKDRASYRERQLILARMQEKGQTANPGDGEARKKAAIQTLDNLLAVHDDDEEAWVYRALLAGGAGYGNRPGISVPFITVAAVPFLKSLLHINPLHPSGNHELVHFYETLQRPALGWVYAENYIKSSPSLPHAYHMQAHLATRIGRWDKTSDRSARAIELEKAYHQEMNVLPRDDYQYSHHLQVLTLSLVHDGRFAEALAIKEVAKKGGQNFWEPWFKLALARGDWDEAKKIIDERRKSDKTSGAYLAAQLYLRQGDSARAQAEVEVLQQAAREHKNDRTLEDRLRETQGWLMCRLGAADAGLKVMQKVAERSKDNYGHHAWGNGAVFMEAWGVAALQSGKLDTAEEAFLEALAHDSGSVIGALGMQVLCERQGRADEAKNFADLARRCWRKAEAKDLAVQLAWLRGDASLARNAAQEKTDRVSPMQTEAKP